MQSSFELAVARNALIGHTPEYPQPQFKQDELARLEMQLLKQLSLGIKEQSTWDSWAVLMTDQFSIEVWVAQELAGLYSSILDSVVNDEPWKCLELLTQYHSLLSEHSGLFYAVETAVLIHGRILFLIGQNSGELPSFLVDLSEFWAVLYRVFPNVIEEAITHRMLAFQAIDYKEPEHTDWEKVGEELLLFYTILKDALLQHFEKKES